MAIARLQLTVAGHQLRISAIEKATERVFLIGQIQINHECLSGQSLLTFSIMLEIVTELVRGAAPISNHQGIAAGNEPYR